MALRTTLHDKLNVSFECEYLVAGEMAVMYLFMRYRFNWNEVKFSMFSTYSMVTNLIGENDYPDRL